MAKINSTDGKNRASLRNLKAANAKAGKPQVTDAARLAQARKVSAKISAMMGVLAQLRAPEIEAAEAEQERQRQIEREAKEQKERAGITLRGPRLSHAQRMVDEINLASVSIYRVIQEAADTSDIHIAADLLVAAENVAMVICRKCDVLAAYMGDGPGFGNYCDHFQAMTEAEAERIEQQEREQASEA